MKSNTSEFGWIMTRRRIIIAIIADIILFQINLYYISYIDNFASLSNTIISIFVWVILSYIFGRYSNSTEDKPGNIFGYITRTIAVLIICISLILSIEVITKYHLNNAISLNTFSKFLISYCLSSSIIQYLIASYAQFKSKEFKSWNFIGDYQIYKLLKAELISNRRKVELNYIHDINNFFKDKSKLENITFESIETLSKENLKIISHLNNRKIEIKSIKEN